MKDFCKGYCRLFIILLLIMGLFVVVPLCFGYHGYVIETGSMEPHIPTGSMVYVKEDDIQLNDVVTYTYNGQVVTHRVVGVDEMNRRLITKGDALKYNDVYKVSFDTVIGKVHYSIPWVGNCVMYFQSLEGKITIGLLFALFIGCNFYEGRKGIKDERKGM